MILAKLLYQISEALPSFHKPRVSRKNIAVYSSIIFKKQTHFSCLGSDYTQLNLHNLKEILDCVTVILEGGWREYAQNSCLQPICVVSFCLILLITKIRIVPLIPFLGQFIFCVQLFRETMSLSLQHPRFRATGPCQAFRCARVVLWHLRLTLLGPLPSGVERCCVTLCHHSATRCLQAVRSNSGTTHSDFLCYYSINSLVPNLKKAHL